MTQGEGGSAKPHHPLVCLWSLLKSLLLTLGKHSPISLLIFYLIFLIFMLRLFPTVWIPGGLFSTHLIWIVFSLCSTPAIRNSNPMVPPSHPFIEMLWLQTYGSYPKLGCPWLPIHVASVALAADWEFHWAIARLSSAPCGLCIASMSCSNQLHKSRNWWLIAIQSQEL